MQGLWAGFDSVNGEIDGGSYSFRRCPEGDVQVATDADAPSVCALLGDALGELYVDLEDIRSMIATDNPDATCLICVDRNGHIIGALTAAIFNQASIVHVLPAGQEGTLKQIPTLRYHQHFCVVRAIAVVSRWRGRGIASRLVTEALDWCRSRGATAALSFGWKSSHGCHIDGVMATTGFQCVGEISNFWTDDSKKRDYFCPECGAVCECAAVIFTRPVDARAAALTAAT